MRVLILLIVLRSGVNYNTMKKTGKGKRGYVVHEDLAPLHKP